MFSLLCHSATGCGLLFLFCTFYFLGANNWHLFDLNFKFLLQIIIGRTLGSCKTSPPNSPFSHSSRVQFWELSLTFFQLSAPGPSLPPAPTWATCKLLCSRDNALDLNSSSREWQSQINAWDPCLSGDNPGSYHTASWGTVKSSSHCLRANSLKNAPLQWLSSWFHLNITHTYSYFLEFLK